MGLNGKSTGCRPYAEAGQAAPTARSYPRRLAGPVAPGPSNSTAKPRQCRHVHCRPLRADAAGPSTPSTAGAARCPAVRCDNVTSRGLARRAEAASLLPVVCGARVGTHRVRCLATVQGLQDVHRANSSVPLSSRREANSGQADRVSDALARDCVRNLGRKQKRGVMFLRSQKVLLDSGGYFDRRSSQRIWRRQKSAFNTLADIARPSGEPRLVELWRTSKGAYILGTDGRYREISDADAFQLVMSQQRRRARTLFPDLYDEWESNGER
jgi:hypothetical protein